MRKARKEIDVNVVAAMLVEGATLVEIAAAIGSSSSGITKCVQRNGLVVPSKLLKGMVTKTTLQRLCKTENKTQIAKTLNVTPYKLAAWLRHYNLTVTYGVRARGSKFSCSPAAIAKFERGKANAKF